jgi:hypothetical protein
MDPFTTVDYLDLPIYYIFQIATAIPEEPLI